MSRTLPSFIFLCLLVFLTGNLKAQKRNKFDFTNPNENFYDTQKMLNKYFKKHQREIEHEQREKAEGKARIGSEEEQELAGYELYKRWEYYMEPRVYPSGDKTLASRVWDEVKAMQQ